MRRDLRANLIFPPHLAMTPDAVAEAATYRAGRRFSMIVFAVQSCCSVRPLSERYLFLVERLRPREVSSVLLDAMQRHGTMLPSSRQVYLAMVCGVYQTPDHLHVLRHLVPNVSQHLAFMNVRTRPFKAQNNEQIYLDGRVRVHPVLRRFKTIIHLTTTSLASGEASGVGRHYDVPSRWRRHDIVVEPLPDYRPSGTAVLATEPGMMRDLVQIKVLLEQLQAFLELSEGRV
jgi:hypothetical protein